MSARILLPAILLLCGASIVQAQTRSLFGDTTTGSQLNNRARTFTGSGQGAAAGAGGIGTDIVTEGIGQITGNERFINRQAGQFVGADSSELAGRFIGAATGAGQGGMGMGQQGMGLGRQGLQGLGGRQGLGGLGGGLGGARAGQAFSFQQQNFGQNGQNPQQQVRVRVTLGFDPPARPEARTSATLDSSLGRMLRGRTAGELAVSIEDRTAILRGTVPTDHARNLAERLAQLEPGIDRVQNELVVAADTGSPAATPADR